MTDERIKTIEENTEFLKHLAQMKVEHFIIPKLEQNRRSKLFQLIDKLQSKGTSWVKIADELTAQGYPTISGRGIWRGTIVKSFYEKIGVETLRLPAICRNVAN